MVIFTSTPTTVRDLYEALSRQEKEAFLKLIASTFTPAMKKQRKRKRKS